MSDKIRMHISNKNLDVSYTGDVEATLERNAYLRTQEQTSTDGMMHVATIPNEVLLKWLNEEWMAGNDIRYLSEEFNQLVDRKLKDPDWAHLLVAGPRHKVGYGN